MKYKFSRPCEITGKIILLLIFIRGFLYRSKKVNDYEINFMKHAVSLNSILFLCECNFALQDLQLS
jgi:hypothetical protein